MLKVSNVFLKKTFQGGWLVQWLGCHNVTRVIGEMFSMVRRGDEDPDAARKDTGKRWPSTSQGESLEQVLCIRVHQPVNMGMPTL